MSPASYDGRFEGTNFGEPSANDFRKNTGTRSPPCLRKRGLVCRTFHSIQWCIGVITLAVWVYLMDLPCAKAAGSRTCVNVTDECVSAGLDCQQSYMHILMPIKMTCGDLLDGSSDLCSDDCDALLQRLLELPVSGWFSCDCRGYEYMDGMFDETFCMQLQENTQTCPSFPPDEPAKTSTVAYSETVGRSPGQPYVPSPRLTTRPPRPPCDDARVACDLSDACQVAFTKVLETCEMSRCSLKCVEAIDKLERHEESAALWRCECAENGANGVARQESDSTGDAAWCKRFEDDFLNECQRTEARNLTYGVLTSTPAYPPSRVHDDDDGGGGHPSPRLDRPSRLIAFGFAFAVALYCHVHVHL